jgi:hypothetical protein
MGGLLVCAGVWARWYTGKGVMLYRSTTVRGDRCIGAVLAVQVQAGRLPSNSQGPAVCFSDLFFCTRIPDPVTSTAFPPFPRKMRYFCTQCGTAKAPSEWTEAGSDFS